MSTDPETPQEQPAEAEDTSLEALQQRVAERRQALGLPIDGKPREQPTPRRKPTDPPLCPSCEERPAQTIKALGRTVVTNRLCAPCAEAHEKADAQRRTILEEADRADRRQNRRERIYELLAGAGFNTRKYGDSRLGDFDPEHDPAALEAAQALLRRFRQGERPSLYLYSKRPGQPVAPGNGKTLLAHALGTELLLDPDVPQAGVAFLFVPKWLLTLRGTFDRKDGPTIDDHLERAIRYEALILDDLGMHNWSDWTVETVGTLLDQRQGRTTIITSNLAPDEIADAAERDPRNTDPYATLRIISRILGECTVVELTGPDRRSPP